jgi:hypothetical protein
MALLTNIVGTALCSQAGVIGTGQGYFPFNFENLAGGGIGLLTRGTELPSDLNIQSTRALQKAGKLIVIKDTVAYEANNAEAQEETFDSGIRVTSTDGLLGFNFTFLKGTMYQRALASLNSQGNYETILFDSAGNILVRRTASGVVRGFSTGLVRAGLPTFSTGGSSEKQMLMLQWTNLSEYNKEVSYISADQLDFTFNADIDGINELKVSLNPVASGATTITGRIASLFDNTLTDASITEAALKVVGATASAATVSEDGVLSITVSAVSAEDKISVSLDGVYENSDNGMLFKSNTATVVVTA